MEINKERGYILDKLDIVEVISRYTDLKKKGPIYSGLCPFHEESTPSFTVYPRGGYKCYGCKEAGANVIDFLERYAKLSYNEIALLANDVAFELKETKVKQRDTTKKPDVIWQQIPPLQPLPDVIMHTAKDPADALGAPDIVYHYYDRFGSIIGAVCRWQLPNGKKTTRPYTYQTNGKWHGWVFRGFGNPMPLYNLHRLSKNRLSPVIVVEGEKAADAATALFARHVVTTWPNGSSNVDHVDLKPLFGRVVILCPDNDQPGYKAMTDLASRLFGHARVMFLPPADPDVDGWDWADFTGHPYQANNFLDRNVRPWLTKTS